MRNGETKTCFVTSNNHRYCCTSTTRSTSAATTTAATCAFSFSGENHVSGHDQRSKPAEWCPARRSALDIKIQEGGRPFSTEESDYVRRLRGRKRAFEPHLLPEGESGSATTRPRHILDRAHERKVTPSSASRFSIRCSSSQGCAKLSAGRRCVPCTGGKGGGNGGI